MASETYVRRRVPEARATRPSMPDIPWQGGDLMMKVQDVNVDELPVLDRPSWEPHLAAWKHARLAVGRSLEGCVVDITAPELGGAELINAAQMATMAGISAGTLRGYMSRGENKVPEPQALIGSRPVWARPVVEEWIEARSYDPEVSERSVSVRSFDDVDVAPGIKDVWEKTYYWFLNRLTSDPETRPRLGLRWRNRDAVQQVAKDLSWQVAAGFKHLLPVRPVLTQVVRDSVIYDLTRSAERRREWDGEDAQEDRHYGLGPHNEAMLGWLVCHDPFAGRRVMEEVVYHVEHHNDLFQTDRDAIAFMFKRALSIDTKLTEEQRHDFVDSAIVDLNGRGSRPVE